MKAFRITRTVLSGVVLLPLFTACIHAPDVPQRELYRHECAHLKSEAQSADTLQVLGISFAAMGAFFGLLHEIIPKDNLGPDEPDFRQIALQGTGGVFLAVGGVMWIAAHSYVPEERAWTDTGCISNDF